MTKTVNKGDKKRLIKLRRYVLDPIDGHIMHLERLLVSIRSWRDSLGSLFDAFGLEDSRDDR